MGKMIISRFLGRIFLVTALCIGTLSVSAQTVMTRLTDFPLDFVPESGRFYGKYLYINNIEDKSVSILDITKSKIAKTITVESAPKFSLPVGKYIYVLNSGTNTVSVINTDTLSLQKTITVGSAPTYATLVGTKIYVSNKGSDSLAVIETTNNLNIKTIENVGSRPTCSIQFSNRLYVCNSDSSSIAVINTTTNLPMTAVVTGRGPIDISIAGRELFVLNNIDKSVSVINGDKNTGVLTPSLEKSIGVGEDPRQIVKSGTKFYIINKGSNSVSVIDSVLKKVVSTIPVGKSPSSAALMAGKLYVTNSGDNTVSIIDTTSDTVVQTLETGAEPYQTTVVSNNIYIYNKGNKTFSIISSNAPILQSLEVVDKIGSYGPGQALTLKATFNRSLLSGSFMNLTLNNGVKIVLDKVNNNIISGAYIIEKNQEQEALNVSSIDASKIIDFTGMTGANNSIPAKKNLADTKKITITNSASPTTLEGVCKNTEMYRLCPLSKAPENSAEYRENMICEGFVSEEQSRSKRVSRIEVLNIAVNMLRGEKSAAADYNNTYTDITPAGNSQETVAVIQTGLDNGLIFSNNGAFEPTKKIPRIEAYALLMRGVCMYPVEGEDDMARAIHQKAIQENITTKQWARFRPYSGITRNEVFILASALADWADKNGGCDKLECRK